MPSFNAAATLPTAVSSLVAQTYLDWECIIIDDGSKDVTVDIVTTLIKQDRRFQYKRFENNKGRGLARQAALERASGQYLALLDADDWVYPDKLEKQVDACRLVPEAALVSSGMAIANESGNLVGVRCQGKIEAPIRSKPPIRLGRVPVAFPPSLIQLDIAKSIGFDHQLRRSEDWDFLLRLLMKNRYFILPDITYVYNEHTSVDFANVQGTIHDSKLVIEKYRNLFPRDYWINRLRLRFSLAIYRILFLLGLGEFVIGRRSAKPTDGDLQRYRQAKETVKKVEHELFGRLPLIYSF